MKTKQQIQESSVEIAFAELGRLERDRNQIAASKLALHAAFSQRGAQLATLRERIVAERPKALARIRLERALRERELELFSAKLQAEAQIAHDQRLTLIRAELEHKRVRLAAIETSGTVPRPARLALEWSVPGAAALLVGVLGFIAFGTDAVARQPAPIVELADASAPVFTPVIIPIAAPSASAPEPVAAPAPSKKPSKKPSKPSKKPSDKPSDKPSEPTPIKKNPKPIDLGGFDGNPLG